MWNKFVSLFKHVPTDIVGIDIGTGSIKIAGITTRNGRHVLHNIGLCELAAGGNQEGDLPDRALLADILKQALLTGGAAATHAVVAVGGRAIFVREVPFPMMKPEELREAIRWDVEKYVPFEPGSYYYDFAVLHEKKEVLEAHVLLVAAPRDTVDVVSGVLRDVGWIPLAVDIEPLALYRTLIAADNSLVVDIGAEVSHIMVFQDGGPVFTRTIPLGGNRFTEVVMRALDLEFGEAETLKKRQIGLLPRIASDVTSSDVHSQMGMLVNDLTNEIRRTIEYFQIQNKEAVLDKLFLSGGGSRLGNLAEQLSMQLDMPVELHDPLAVVDVQGSFDPEYVRDLGPQLAVAIGLALRGGEA